MAESRISHDCGVIQVVHVENSLVAQLAEKIDVRVRELVPWCQYDEGVAFRYCLVLSVQVRNMLVRDVLKSRHRIEGADICAAQNQLFSDIDCC